MTGILDPRPGMTAGFGYDALDRLTSASGGWGTLGYRYDAVGNRLSSTLNGVTTTYTYDPATNRLASTSGGQVESFAYDLDGRLTSDGLSSSYAYTPTNQLEAALTQAGALNLYRYDADGQRVLKIAGGGAGTTSVVNGLSEFPPSPAYEPRAHAGFGETSPKRFARRRAGVGGPITWTVDYVYAGTRLLAAVRPAVGTLDTLTVVKAGSGRVSAVPAGLDCGPDCSARYLDGTAVTLTAVPAAGFVFGGWSGACSGTAASVTVTMSGNVSCTATFGHRLTVAARLKSGSPYNDVEWTSSPAGIDCWTSCAATFPSGTVVTLYTSEGPSSWSGDCSLHQSLTMDGDKTCIAIFNNYLGPIRLGAQTSSAVESAASGATLVTTSMDTPTTLQAVEYYHLDAIGSVRAVTDADGTVTARHDFRPFGEELNPQIPPHDRKLFTGQERDFETGLDYFHARQLRVNLGRFTTPDPVTDLAWTDPTLGATNPYGYVNNNPLGFIDASGAQDEQIVVHPNWWDRFLAWLSGPLVFRSGVEVCISCNSSPGPSSLVGGITGSAGTVGFGSSEPSHEPSQQPEQTKKKAPCLPQSALTPFERAELTAARFWASQTGKTVGFGMGASGGFGVGGELGGFGAGGGISRSISADAYGNAARITSYTFNALNYGAGVLAGLQVSYSPAPLSSGPSAAMQFSGSYGSGLGAGFAVDPVRGAGAATFGVGYGARLSGSVSDLSFETIALICR